MKSKARPASARPVLAAAKVAVSGPDAIGVKDAKRTGYVMPAPFQIKKSVKPLTSVQGFTLKTASLASKDARERENSNATQVATACVNPACKAAAKVSGAGAGRDVVGAGASALTPKRNVKAPSAAVGALGWHSMLYQCCDPLEDLPLIPLADLPLCRPARLVRVSGIRCYVHLCRPARLVRVSGIHSYVHHAQENGGSGRRRQEAEARTSEKRSKSVLAARLQVGVEAGGQRKSKGV